MTIADFCNECGNCETFCPTNGAPYRSKPKICLTENSYNDEKEAYRFLRINDKIAIKAKYDGKEESLRLRDGEYIYTTRHIRAVLHKDTFRVKECDVHTPHKEEITLQRAAEMSLLLRAFGDSYFRCC